MTLVGVIIKSKKEVMNEKNNDSSRSRRNSHGIG